MTGLLRKSRIYDRKINSSILRSSEIDQPYPQTDTNVAILLDELRSIDTIIAELRTSSPRFEKSSNRNSWSSLCCPIHSHLLASKIALLFLFPGDINSALLRAHHETLGPGDATHTWWSDNRRQTKMIERQHQEEWYSEVFLFSNANLPLLYPENIESAFPRQSWRVTDFVRNLTHLQKWMGCRVLRLTTTQNWIIANKTLFLSWQWKASLSLARLFQRYL